MSQSRRKVVVASPASNKAKAYQTSATTWGEFKAEISDLLTGNVEAVNPEGNVTFTRDDAKLPTGEFRVFLIPTKNKAGGVTPSQAQQLGREIGDAIVKASQLVDEQELSNLKDKLIDTIGDFFGVDLNEDCPECDDALEEARNLMP